MQHFSYLFIFWIVDASHRSSQIQMQQLEVRCIIEKVYFHISPKFGSFHMIFFLVGCSQWSWSCLLFNTTIDNAQLAIDMDSWKPFTWSLLNWVRYVAVFIWNTANMSEKRCCCSDHNHVSIDANKKWFCTLNW